MRRVALALLLAVVTLIVGRPARADAPGAHTVAVAVLALDSEDAEEQADALTGGLRSRIRNAPGWSLVETTQSLGMLTAALRCPARPNADCQQKIAEQIKVERYLWGFVQKGPQQGQVTAEIHFYQRNKPDTVIKESYADNLKDPQDDKGLGKIAQRVLERLGGSAMGTVVVKASGLEGEVIVDGEKHVPLAQGAARIDLGAGGHSIEIASPGTPTTKRNILVTAGRETVVDVGEPQGAQPQPQPEAPSKPFPTMKLLAGVAVVAGIALEVVTVLEYGKYKDALDAGDRDKASVPAGQAPCQDAVQFKQFCDDDNNAKDHSRLAIITGIGGAVLIGGGVALWFIDSSGDKASVNTGKKTRVTPIVGAGTGGLVLSGSF